MTEIQFSYLSDFLFINFLNTVNNKYNRLTDIFEESMLEDWLSLMEEEGVLSPHQLTKLREEDISIKKLQTFRDDLRSHFIEASSPTHVIQLLEDKTEKVPLFFKASEDAIIPVPCKGGTDGLISLIAYSMLEAHRNGILLKVKSCENPNCVALFVDKKGKRKWCSMKVCGNRVKAQKHYMKKKDN